MPQVSVVMPAYNAQKYIAQSIQSVLDQSFSDWELVILDDGSTDDTAKIVRSFSDPRIVYHHQPNAGIVTARNKAMSMATAPLIATLDSDDVMEHARLEKQLREFQLDSDLVLLGSNIKIIDESSEVVGLREYPAAHEKIKKSITRFNPIAQPAAMFCKSAYEKAGGYSKTIYDCAEDYLLWARMLLEGKAKNLQEPLTQYRVHLASSKSTKTQKQIKATLAVKTQMRKKLGYSFGVVDWARVFAERVLSLMPPIITLTLFKALTYKKSS